MTTLRSLPSVDLLIQQSSALIAEFGRPLTVRSLRATLEAIRANVQAGRQVPSNEEILSCAKSRLIGWTKPTLEPVINATGVILHTNLGRAPLSKSAMDAMLAASTGYTNLEFDLETGKRGSRLIHAEALLRQLTGAEAAVVVNNCASAVLLTLSALAKGKRVIIPRSQLIEIGGGFRLPDVMKQSGAKLVEIGTTNKVRLADYEEALSAAEIRSSVSPSAAEIRSSVSPSAAEIRSSISPSAAEIRSSVSPSAAEIRSSVSPSAAEIRSSVSPSAANSVSPHLPVSTVVMRAHRSNFRIIGFTEEPTLGDMVKIAHKYGAIFIDDLGSGTLIDVVLYGMAHEPTVQESLAAGADVVMFSGDKLLGGPQAGIILGRADLLAKIKKHPLARAVRADKTRLAALSATLVHYLKDEAEREIPIWQMIAQTPENLKARAEAWKTELGCGQVVPAESTVGGGSLPGENLPTFALGLSVRSPDKFLAKLRKHTPAIIARVENDQILFDPRTVLPEQEPILLAALREFL